MNKGLALKVLAAVAAGVLITMASFWVKSSSAFESITCPPVGARPLDELFVASGFSKLEHGFPFRYYKSEVPPSCQVKDTTDASTNSQISWLAGAADVLIWSLAAFMIVMITSMLIRRKT